MNKLPLLAVTMGDPAGIGPEIAARALLSPQAREKARLLLIGDEAPLRHALSDTLRLSATVRVVQSASEADFAPGIINLLPLGLVGEGDYALGEASAAAGNAAFHYVRRAIELAMAGDVDGTVTGPLCKESLQMAGHHFAGHTEIYAHYTGVKQFSMMLAHGSFRVVHVSTHVSLREACDRVKQDRVHAVIRLAQQACESFGIDRPRIAVAGLNPHAGENGMFGREEIDEIQPAIAQAVAEGLDVTGPVPPDTVFSKMHAGLYDICVAMYHDQGHIPVKLLGFTYDQVAQRWNAVSGVNITLGLPIIRVSVDHGTAFDIAGKGIASADSLISAIEYAAAMSVHADHASKQEE